MLGLWDSGLGGLSVAAAVAQRMPRLSFLYRADHAHAPYGSRRPGDILALATAEVSAMFDAGCALVIFACNTASVSALRDIQQQWLPNQKFSTPRNVLGVVVPVVEEWLAHLHDLTVQPAAPTVQVFATDHTVRSQVFITEIYKRAPGVRVGQTACPDLVPAMERGAGADELRELVNQYVKNGLQNFGAPDSVILGCTHYALIRDLFAAALPAGTPILDQPAALADKLEQYLARHPEYTADYSATRIFTTTGDAARVNETAQTYFRQLSFPATGQPPAFFPASEYHNRRPQKTAQK